MRSPSQVTGIRTEYLFWGDTVQPMLGGEPKGLGDEFPPRLPPPPPASLPIHSRTHAPAHSFSPPAHPATHPSVLFQAWQQREASETREKGSWESADGQTDGWMERKEGALKTGRGREEEAVDPAPSLNNDLPTPATPHAPRQGDGSQSQSCLSETKASPFPRKQGEGRPRAASGIQARQQEDFPPEGCGKACGGLSLGGRLHSLQRGAGHPAGAPRGHNFSQKRIPLDLAMFSP